MRKRFINAGIQTLAGIFIILGLLGLFLPFLQGIIFLIIGISLLSVSSPTFKTWIDKRLERFPKAKARFDRGHERVSRWFTER